MIVNAGTVTRDCLLGQHFNWQNGILMRGGERCWQLFYAV